MAGARPALNASGDVGRVATVPTGTIPPGPLRDTLVAVGRLLRGAADPWWVVGSAAAALHGASPIHVADVDVLLSPADARRSLSAIGLATAPGTGSDLFRSDVFATWPDTPLPTEFMVGFHHRRRGAWLLVEPRTRHSVDVSGVALHVPYRVELRAMLVRFGRPKDLSRARLLGWPG